MRELLRKPYKYRINPLTHSDISIEYQSDFVVDAPTDWLAPIGR